MTVKRLGYEGKHAVVVGGATGIGAEAARQAAELGAEVTVMDVADVSFPVGRFLRVDLRDRASVDAALAELHTPVDALFSCAGVADGTSGLMLINFIAQRYVIDRLVATDLLREGSAAAMISSVAGLGWERQLETLLDFLRHDDWDSAVAWVSAHEGTDNYLFSKQVINAYVASTAIAMARRGMRINAVLPGPTDTPLARANAETWLTFGAGYREAAQLETLEPRDIANVIVFLCSDAASAINGITLLADQGHVGSSITGSFDEPIVKMLLGTD